MDKDNFFVGMKNQFIEELIDRFVIQFSEKLGTVRREKKPDSGTWFNLDDICAMLGCRDRKSGILVGIPRSEIDHARNMVSGRVAYKLIMSSSDSGILVAVRKAAVDTITIFTQSDSELQEALAAEKRRRMEVEKRLSNICCGLRRILDEASGENALGGNFTL